MQNDKDTLDPTTTIKNWVELYSDSLFSWAFYKTSSKEASEDLVQETFMVVVQTFEKFEKKGEPKTWLFAILNHKIYDHYRRNFRTPILTGDSFTESLFDSKGNWKSGERPQLWTDETEHLSDNLEFQKTLNFCMEKLPDNWLSAIQLKYMEERSGELICQELDITPTNFWQILHRAKLQLRKCLELNWFKK